MNIPNLAEVTEVLSKKDEEAYVSRVIAHLLRNGCTCMESVEDEGLRSYITNYMEQEIFPKEEEMKQRRRTIRLANVSVDIRGTQVEYPVIHIYHRHTIEETRYFARSGDSFHVETVHIKPSPLILLP